MYDGVTMMTSGRRSRISVTCRSVWPPLTGITVQPNACAPSCAPSPPVNSPYP